MADMRGVSGRNEECRRRDFTECDVIKTRKMKSLFVYLSAFLSGCLLKIKNASVFDESEVV